MGLGQFKRTAAELSTVAKVRQSEPSKLIHLVRGDLDWIVMKCLEKDRTRRYETANGLAADINRHLENEPVLARSPGNLYRFQKMARRNKLAFAAAAIVMASLLLGTSLATWQAVRASRERDAKELARREAVAAEREQTRLREQAESEAYASDMLLAQQAIAANNFGHARELLYRHRPHSKYDRDLRGWEWRYLWQQCTSDALARVWQAPTKVTGMVVSGDGKWLAVGQNSDLAAVSLLEFTDRTTARVVTNIPARRGTDVAVAFSPTEPLLAFNSTEYSATNVQCLICLWNVQKQHAVFKRSIRSFCAGLAFSPDGSTLMVAVMNHLGKSDSQLLLLRVADGTVLKEQDARISTPAPVIAVDPAFKFAAIGGDSLQLFGLANLKPIWSATNGQGFSTSEFIKDGTVLITVEGDADSTLQMREVGSGKPIGQAIPMRHGAVNTLALSPDGQTLVSGTDDGTIQVWDVSGQAILRSLGRPLRGNVSGVKTLTWLADGDTLLSGSFDGSIYGWRGTPPPADASRLVLTGVFAWHFVPDGRSLLTIDPDGRVLRREGHDFERATPVLDTGLNLVEHRDRAEFSDDATLLACSGDSLGAGRDEVVRVWDLRSRASPPKLVTPGALGVRGFAPVSNLLVLYNRLADSVEEWDLNACQKVRSWPKIFPSRNVYLLLALSTGGKYLLNASVNGDEALLRNVATGQTSDWNDLGAGFLSDVTFSPNGALIAMASQRGSAQVWESASQRRRMTVGHQQLPLYAVSFSPDGSRLMTGSNSPEAVMFWDLEGRELLTLQGPGNWTESFNPPGISADGNLLGRKNSQSELYIWRAPSWAEIETTEKTVSDSQIK